MTATIPSEDALGSRPTKREKSPVERGLTFWLFFPTVALVAGLFIGFCLGVVPWWVNWIVAAPCYYFLIICGHDALHSAAHGTRRGNDAVGWIGTQLFGLPYPMVRRAHLSHHARDGAPDDIERFAYLSGPTLPLRILFGNWMYYGHLPECNRREWALAIATVVGTLALFVLCPWESLVGWFLPMQTGACYIAITTIWIPHGPYARWWMTNFPFITGYHEDHHIQPYYPFHQISLPSVRARGQALLRSRGRVGKYATSAPEPVAVSQ